MIDFILIGIQYFLITTLCLCLIPFACLFVYYISRIWVWPARWFFVCRKHGHKYPSNVKICERCDYSPGDM